MNKILNKLFRSRRNKMEEKKEKPVLEHDLSKESHDEFWEKECKLHPDALECRMYDD